MDFGLIFKSTLMLRAFFLTVAITQIALTQANDLPLRPGHVAVLYNSSEPESRELAQFYAEMRRIPQGNMVGIPMPRKQDISRKEYEDSIRDPLREVFSKRQWWTLAKDTRGVTLPSDAIIRCVAVMKGVPLRITRIAPPASEAEKKAQFFENNEASVDSELSVFGIQKYPIGSAIPNPYFDKEISFVASPVKFMTLVGRVDAKDYLTCQQMILDALTAEKTGLWGRTYVDFSRKPGAFAVGDQWLEGITKRAMRAGAPVITDRNKETYTTNYPMEDAAVYFGWYTWNRNGPFLNPAMRFRTGAVAVHLHSLSAAQMADPSKNWSSALLDRGAAATLGNTWEPYLQMSHNFDIFHDRLLKGYSIVESAYMAANTLSWQGVVFGDPLYRPFKDFATPPQDLSKDKEYKAIRLSHLQWTDPEKLTPKLRGLAAKLNSGTIYEAMGYGLLESKQYPQAHAFFESAKALYPSQQGKLRQLLNQVEVARRQKNTPKALQILRDGQSVYANLPEVKSIAGLITILDPPAPPPTQPKK